MKKTRKWLVAGAAAVIVAGTAAIAEAQSPTWHSMTVTLPGGGVEHVTYSGDVRPEIVVMPNARFANSVLAPFTRPLLSFWEDPVFADMDRISAQMDREMNAMMQQAATLQAGARQGVYNASLGKVAPGTVEYSQISTWSRNGVCTRTMRLTSSGDDRKPQMVSSTSGDCGGTRATTPSGTAIPAKAVMIPHDTAAPPRTL